MNISEVLTTLKAEIAFKRTPMGRPITDYAVEALSAALEDQKNFDIDIVKCLNCSLIQSSLLVPEGCPSCGSKDLSTEITKADII